jgi:hypothetical protein
MDPTRLGRLPDRGSHEPAAIAAILDAAPMCHVAFVDDGRPVCIPTLHVRIDDAVYVHGSIKSRMMRLLAEGAEACLTASVLDGLVLARSAFHHSVNYRSVVVFGRGEAVPLEGRRRVLDALVDRIAPGRAAAARPPTAGELEATAVIRLPLALASAKQRTGPPIDAAADLGWPIWAGVLPVALRADAPLPAPDALPGHAPPRAGAPYAAAR